jgi:hypothetical protein
MPARLFRERFVITLVGSVRLSSNHHSGKLFSFDCVDSLTLLRIVADFSNGLPKIGTKSSCRKSRCQRGESNEAKNRDSNPGDHDEVAKAHIKTPQSGVGSIHVSMTSKEFISSDTACQYEPGMRQIRSLRLNQL